MPKHKMVMKDALDRFYTKDCIAELCLSELYKYVDKESLFVEPSAGSGSFFNKLPSNKVGIDLSPETDGIIYANWLEYDVSDGCVVVGNPPFGQRNSLSKAFIKHALPKAKVIAFILPTSYRKETTQSVFPKEWVLVSSVNLPENSFTFEGEDYHVPCVFQVWVKNSSLDNLRESAKVKITTEDFEFCKKEEASFFIFGASPSKIVEKELVKPNNRGYYIKQKVSDVEDKFKQIDWSKRANSTVSGGVAWFSKQEIINIYEELKNDYS